MIKPEAVMNPETTGCDRKLARKPKRSKPMASSIRPESSAMAMAVLRYSALPGAATWPTAVAVMSDTTATGPTESVRLVPRRA